MTLFEKNLALLKERCPACADWLETSAEDPRVESLEIAPGKIDLRVTGKNKQNFLFYNTEEPLENEKKLFQEHKFEKNCATFLVGLGLGYNVSAIAEKMENKHTLVVVECNATIMKQALKVMDLNFILQKESRIIFCPPEPEIIEQVATRIFVGEMGFDAPDDVKILLHPAANAISSEYSDHFRHLESLFNYYMVNLKTRTHCAHSFAMNEIKNLPQVVSSPGIHRLTGCFPGFPAIVVSAGPSLHKNIHLLKRIQNRALIIATAPVVRILLAYDIQPHLVGSMDFSEENYPPFEGICDQEKIPLVYLTRLYPPAVGDYQGDLVVVPQNEGIVTWLKDFWGYKGNLRGCGNVGLFCFYIAEAMGADPIILIGQDLAFSQNSTHTEGVMGRRPVDPKKEDFIWVEGNQGDKVPVTTAFLAYIKQFKEAVAGVKKLCINATEGGAYIEGTVVLPLQEAIESYCCEERDVAGLIEAALEKSAEDSADYPGLLQEMERSIKTLRDIKKLSQKGLNLNRKIRKESAKLANREEGRLNKLIRENYEVSTEVQKFSHSFNLLQIYMAKEIYEINRGEYLPDPDKIYDPEVMTTGLKRNRLILQAAERTAVELSNELRRNKDLIKEFYHCQTEVFKAPDDPLRQFHWGRVLLEIGYGKKARAAFLRSLELGMSGPELLLDLADCYERCGCFKEAKKILQSIEQEDPQIKERVHLKKSWLDGQEEKWLTKAKTFWDEGDWINTLLYSRKVRKGNSKGFEAEEMIQRAFQVRENAILKGDRERIEWGKQWEVRRKYKNLFEGGKRLFDEGRFHEAVITLNRALALPSIETVEVQVLLACAYSELGEIGKTEELLREAMAQSPNTGLFHINLGRAFLRNGYLLEGVNELEKAVQKEGRFYEHHMEIGNINFQLKDYEKALSHFNQYLNHNQGSYEALTKVGNCNLAQGFIEAAQVYYKKALNLKSDYPAAQAGIFTVDRVKQNRMKNS